MGPALSTRGRALAWFGERDCSEGALHHQATNRQSSMCTAGMNMNKHTAFFGAFLSNMHCHWRPETVTPLGLFSPRRHGHFRVFPHSSHFASSPALPCRRATHNVNKPATCVRFQGVWNAQEDGRVAQNGTQDKERLKQAQQSDGSSKWIFS